MKILVCACLLLISVAARAERANPSDFYGVYRLMHERLGMCGEDNFRIWGSEYAPGELGIHAGGWFFPKVNVGKFTRDNEIDSGEFETYTTADGRLIHEGRLFHKIRRDYEHRRYVVRISGDRMTLSARTVGRYEQHTECSYRLVSRPDLP